MAQFVAPSGSTDPTRMYIFIRNNFVKRILFLADRKNLVTQAKEETFERFLPSIPMSAIIEGKREPEEDKARIRSYYRHQILTARKEFNHEQNRNYHMTSNRPTEILRYLEWNKEVHQNGLIKNMVTGIIASGFICAGVGTTLAAVVLGIQAIDSVINFQCINLQNYNIYRIEARRDGLEKIAARRMEMAEKKYGEAAKVISRTFRETKEESLVPTPEAIIARIENPEQLMQLKMMVEAAKKTYQTSETKTGVKGGKSK